MLSKPCFLTLLSPRLLSAQSIFAQSFPRKSVFLFYFIVKDISLSLNSQRQIEEILKSLTIICKNPFTLLTFLFSFYFEFTKNTNARLMLKDFADFIIMLLNQY